MYIANVGFSEGDSIENRHFIFLYLWKHWKIVITGSLL